MLLAYQQYRKQEAEEDRRLWTALRNGQKESLEELFNDGLKITHNHELVKEVIQQLFLNLWKHHRFLEKARSVKAYLLSSLRRLMFGQIKRRKAIAAKNRGYIDSEDDTLFSAEELLIQKVIVRKKIQILLQVPKKDL